MHLLVMKGWGICPPPPPTHTYTLPVALIFPTFLNTFNNGVRLCLPAVEEPQFCPPLINHMVQGWGICPPPHSPLVLIFPILLSNLCLPLINCCEPQLCSPPDVSLLLSMACVGGICVKVCIMICVCVCVWVWVGVGVAHTHSHLDQISALYMTPTK